MNLETAICPHLQTKRTLPTATPPAYDPPFPAFSSRFERDAEQEMVMVIVGAQAHHGHVAPDALAFVQRIMTSTELSSSVPKGVDTCTFEDHFGKYNLCMLAYWPTKDAYRAWKKDVKFDDWWHSPDRVEDQDHGWFLEEFMPSFERLETVFSNNQIYEGFSHMEVKKSEPIMEHAYWGSMRDRLPLSQTDPLVNGKEGQVVPARPSSEAIVPGRRTGTRTSNLCIIRSGQDWSFLEGKERKMYLDAIHPTLIKGMTFLRDQGEQVGCHDCRFMQVVHPNDLTPSEQTFGLAYFTDLSHLEAWAKDHPTHLEIFFKFLQYAEDLQGDVHLRLYHDVFVLKPDQQSSEYINCHAASGMLQ